MGLARTAVRGVVGFGALNVVRYIITLATLIGLANLLTPEIFGTVTLAVTILTFLMLALRWGEKEAILQDTDNDAVFSTIFWLQFVATIGLLMIIFLLFFPIAVLYGDDVAFALVVIAVPKALGTVSSPFTAALQEAFHLGLVGFAKLLSVGIASPVSIWIALQGEGLLALVSFYAIQDVIRSFTITLLSPRYPDLVFDRETARWFAGFAREMWLSKILNSVESRGDDYLIGSLGSTATLGVYEISWRIAVAFKTIAQPAINQALLPTFASLKDSEPRSARALQFLLRMQLYVAVPGYVFVALVAPELISFTFGNQWREAAPILAVLSITGVLAPVMATVRQFYYSRGNAGTVYQIQRYYLATLLVSMVVFVPTLGGLGGAISVNLMSLVATVLFFCSLRRELDLDIWQTLGPPGIAGLVTTAIGLILQQYWLKFSSPIRTMLAYSAIVAILYGALLTTLAYTTLRGDLAVVKRALLDVPE